MEPGHNNASGPPQPQAPAMMPPPDKLPGCPPGLEYLTQIDQLLVHQQAHLAEAILGWESNNKYTVKNTLGQQVFQVTEETDCCTRQFCGPGRPFTLHVHDNLGQEVMRLTRPLRCGSCCCPCCLQELTVESPPGVELGYIVQQWHLYLPKFLIMNERREPVLRLQGPCLPCSCGADVVFEVKSLDETSVVGEVRKQWTGFIREAFTDADNFGMTFPMDLDVKVKALLLGGLFLIDFMFFETQKQN